MPKRGKNKTRFYVTLDPENVKLAYEVKGPRRLSRLLDGFLAAWATAERARQAAPKEDTRQP